MRRLRQAPLTLISALCIVMALSRFAGALNDTLVPRMKLAGEIQETIQQRMPRHDVTGCQVCASIAVASQS